MHTLVAHTAFNDHACDKCGDSLLPAGTVMQRCHECDYDVCPRCCEVASLQFPLCIASSKWSSSAFCEDDVCTSGPLQKWKKHHCRPCGKFLCDACPHSGHDAKFVHALTGKGVGYKFLCAKCYTQCCDIDKQLKAKTQQVKVERARKAQDKATVNARHELAKKQSELLEMKQEVIAKELSLKAHLLKEHEQAAKQQENIAKAEAETERHQQTIAENQLKH